MFSGIIAAVGRITHLTAREAGSRLHVEAGNLGLDDVALGDCIACNGVCLTVVGKEANRFLVDVSPETLSCTVGLDAPGEINLEKALRLMDRLGGHLVSGHPSTASAWCGASTRSATTACWRSAPPGNWPDSSRARARSRPTGRA